MLTLTPRIREVMNYETSQSPREVERCEENAENGHQKSYTFVFAASVYVYVRIDVCVVQVNNTSNPVLRSAALRRANCQCLG